MKKILGVTQRIAVQENYHERRELLALDWGRFFSKLKIIPFPLSYEIDFEYYVPLLDGVVFSGGNDLSIVTDCEDSQMRDVYERRIIDICAPRQIPILGICRGAQMIASYFDSTLAVTDGHLGHHPIIWNSGKSEYVNSYHHYKISHLGEELECLAFSRDRSIEAFRHRKYLIFGAMWHPEREEAMTESTQKIFELFLEKIK